MTQNDIDNDRLISEIGVSPAKPAEFVVFRISQTMVEGEPEVSGFTDARQTWTVPRHLIPARNQRYPRRRLQHMQAWRKYTSNRPRLSGEDGDE